MKGWTEKEQLYLNEVFGTEVIELFWKYSDELEPDDVAADRKQMRDGPFVFSQVVDAIRRLVKLCVAADRLREEKRAVDVVARTSQTGGVQASIFGTDKTMIGHAKPMREAAPLYVPPKGSGTSDDKTSVDAKGYFIYNWVYTPWNRADVMALKTAFPDPRKNPAALYEEVEGTISSCTMTLADIDLFFRLILPPDMWRTVHKVDDRVVFGASWKELEQMDGDREPAKKPYQLILDLPETILVKLKTIIPSKKIDWTVLAPCKQKTDESVSDFFPHFEEAFHGFSGQLLSDDTGRYLLVDKYVTNLLPGIARRLKACESSWTISTPVSLLTMAQYYERLELEER
ncbi:hypothetical protein NDU88_001743 [Pleurodeles waltl]|uniref:Uncharacterized protein n=1 Tax=Pleurodeles waltl TaxID=8319 RepID=A0AAV7WMH0_PLEWA|nr:hypothetical protein NDU88_001743 [Pleurodeles waltl]